ncbi:MAG TPA: DUF3240 family protein [Gammaproteobacteria bacterium]
MIESSGLVAVTLDLAPALEERVVDWLLSREDVETFTSRGIQGHGSARHELSIAEQVSGRQRRVELRIELAAAVVDGWLAALAETFGGGDVRYSVVPIIRSGRLHELRPPTPSSG